MDIFSEEITSSLESDLNPSETIEFDEDIQFEEVIDINEVQKQLKDELVNEKTGKVVSPEPNIDFEQITNEKIKAAEAVVTKKAVLINQNCKKYVIYIDPENIDFMENLSINERKDVVNKILKEQNEHSINLKKAKEISRFFKHAILVCITVLITFPTMFALVNKALEVTIANYGKSRENFTKLYKEQGKIQMQDNNTVPEVKY